MKSGKIGSLLLALIAWVPIVFFSTLLAHNAILYFTHGGEYGILPEKLFARQDLFWNVAFYVHLPAGIICLFAPMISFAKTFLRNGLRFHQYVGRLYTWVTLFIVCPTGMYLAFYAKGGAITQAGFLLQGLLLAVFSYKGYKAIIKGDKLQHVRFMIRSYAVAIVVLSFRIYHILFFLLAVPYQDNYAISQWLGLVGNIFLAEMIIIIIEFKNQKIQTLKTQL
jgi:hypothetical protein